MYSDPAFSQAILSRDALALLSTGLDSADLALLMGLDPRALAADPGGRRRSQLLGNSASEFTLSLAACVSTESLGDLLEGFPASFEFHTALMERGRLPLAFGSYALRRASDAGAKGVLAMLGLEQAMACLRRSHLPPPIPSPHPPQGDRPIDLGAPASVPEILGKTRRLRPGEVRLSQSVRLVELPLGVFSWAVALQAALEVGQEAPKHEPILESETKKEVVLLKRLAAQTPFQLPTIQPELLSFPTDALLWLARAPLSRARRSAFAQEQGSTPAALESFVASFLEEGILELGLPEPD